MIFDENSLQWTREPQDFWIRDGKIGITTKPHTDLWQRTYYHFRNDNAPVLQMETEEKYFSFLVKTDFSQSHHRFDQCGIVLYGRKIEEIFADVSDEDFWSAISADVDEYDFHAYNARYFASNVLILGRILSFKKEKRILSKYEGGLWMRKNVPENLQYLPELAMKIWFEGEEHILPEEDLDQLRDYLVREIKAP